MIGIATVPESELELVVDRLRRFERAAVDVDDVPRLARRVRQPGTVRVVGVEIDAAVLVRSAARREAVSPSVPGVLRVHEQAGTEHMVVFDLPQPVKRV